MSKKHVVFDCDGTLVSSMGMVRESCAMVLSDYLDREVSLDEVEKHFDPIIEKFYASFGITSPQEFRKIQDKWLELVKTHDFSYSLFGGVAELLNRLQNEFELYVWTARDKYSTLKLLEELQVLSHFNHVSSGTCGPVKPDPSGIVSMLGHVNPQDVVMIGDTYADILGAKNFGCPSIGVTWCPNVDVESLENYGADRIVQTPRECHEEILSLLKKA